MYGTNPFTQEQETVEPESAPQLVFWLAGRYRETDPRWGIYGKSQGLQVHMAKGLAGQLPC